MKSIKFSKVSGEQMNALLDFAKREFPDFVAELVKSADGNEYFRHQIIYKNYKIAGSHYRSDKIHVSPMTPLNQSEQEYYSDEENTLKATEDMWLKLNPEK